MRKLTVIYSLPLIVLSLTACSGGEVKSSPDSKKDPSEESLALMARNCFACHNPEMDGSPRVAPPMFKIRNHYFDDETSRDEFIQEIIAFVNNPSEDLSIMPGAVRNFGLMPKMSFKNEDLEKIAGYIYDNDIESDEWYEKWETFKKSGAKKEFALNYEDLGRDIANKTKAELGKNLMAAVKSKGVVHAIDFCNTRAIPLTDSMSYLLSADVKRVSDKPRNPANAANKDELDYIAAWKMAKGKGESLAPKVFEKGGKMVGYYPIETNQMCLKCHGTPNKTIEPAALKAIQSKYPKDQATGYGENEIRGIFVVAMEKRK